MGFDAEAPLERDGDGGIADLVVAGLIAESAADGECAVRRGEGLECLLLGEGEVAFDAEFAFKDGDGFLDGGQVEGFGGGVAGIRRFGFGEGIDGPRDGDIVLDAGRVNVHFRGQIGFKDEADAEAAVGEGVAGAVAQAEVAGGSGLPAISGFGGGFEQDRAGGVAFAVVLLEVSAPDEAAGVDDEGAGPGDAVEGRSGGDGFVQQAEGADDFRLGVGEQRDGDAAAPGEMAEDFDRIIAERGDGEALFREGLFLLFQLDQLGFAPGSPVGGAVEDEDEAVGALQGVEGLGAAVLVASGEGGDGLSGGGTGAGGHLGRQRGGRDGGEQQCGEKSHHRRIRSRTQSCYDGTKRNPHVAPNLSLDPAGRRGNAIACRRAGHSSGI